MSAARDWQRTSHDLLEFTFAARSRAGATHMLVDVFSETIIARPRWEVAAYAVDPTHAPEWYENVQHVEWETLPPLGLGSKVAFVAQFLGKRVVYTYEVVTLKPGERLVMRTTAGPFTLETTYGFETLGPRRTRMMLHQRSVPPGVPGLVAPLIELALRRANRKHLRCLKQKLELGC